MVSACRLLDGNSGGGVCAPAALAGHAGQDAASGGASWRRIAKTGVPAILCQLCCGCCNPASASGRRLLERLRGARGSLAHAGSSKATVAAAHQQRFAGHAGKYAASGRASRRSAAETGVPATSCQLCNGCRNPASASGRRQLEGLRGASWVTSACRLNDGNQWRQCLWLRQRLQVTRARMQRVLGGAGWRSTSGTGVPLPRCWLSCSRHSSSKARRSSDALLGGAGSPARARRPRRGNSSCLTWLMREARSAQACHIRQSIFGSCCDCMRAMQAGDASVTAVAESQSCVTRLSSSRHKQASGGAALCSKSAGAPSQCAGTPACVLGVCSCPQPVCWESVVIQPVCWASAVDPISCAAVSSGLWTQ